MVKSISYQEKVEKIGEWIPQILEEIKREIKREHLRKAPAFLQKFFGGKNINAITTEEIVDVYTALLKRSEPQFVDQICYFWQVKHPELYPFFQSKLQVISEDVAEITEIEDALACKIVEESVAQFGAVNTYLFSLFYEVALSDAIFESLRARALEETKSASAIAQQEEETRNCELLRIQHERLMTRMREKYEKKLSALEEKYHTDIGRLRRELTELREADPSIAGKAQTRKA